MPVGEHLTIIEFETIHTPGDERSRINPGHGYPASTETTIRYTAYKLEDEALWARKVEALEKGRETYIALKKGVRVAVTLKAVIE